MDDTSFHFCQGPNGRGATSFKGAQKIAFYLGANFTLPVIEQGELLRDIFIGEMTHHE